MDKAPKVKPVLKKMVKIAAPYKKWYIFMTLISVSLILLDLAFAQNSRVLFDNTDNITTELAVRIIIGFIIIIAAQYVLGFANGWITSYVNESIVYKMRKDTLGKVQRLPISFFDKNHSSKVMSIFFDQLETTKHFIVYDLLNLLKLPLTFIITGIYLVTVHPMLGITAFAASALQLLSNLTFKKKLADAIENQRKVTEDVFFTMGETLQGIREVKTDQLEEGVDAKMEDCHVRGVKYNLKLTKYYSLRNIIKELPMKLGYILGVGAAIFLMMNGDIKAGGLMAFITLISKVGEPFNGIVGIITNLQNIMVKARGFFSIDDEQSENLDTGIPIAPGAPDIQFKDVSFKYNEEAGEVLKDITFNIKKGSTIAIVGPSGAGKSTLVKLLYKFYNIDSGEIKINGIDIDEYSVSSLRSSMSIVSQDIFIFDGTIRDNLNPGGLDLDEEDIKKALGYAQALDFVEKLPDGLNTRVGERGVRLSHGQKQRISIARAILKNSNIVILDEPTSALDVDTEYSFQQGLGKWAENCTRIIIAHRLSTIREADYVIFIDEGCIIESGEPSVLVESEGRFSEFYKKSGMNIT